MSILGSADVEMNGSLTTKAKRGKKGVKDASVKVAVSALAKKGEKAKKAKKPAVLAAKVKGMKETKVIKNQIWMKAVKELAGKKNLTPIHQEVLTKIVNRTCLPQHEPKFMTFVENCLKIKKEKYGTALEELFSMLKKIYRKNTQTAGIRVVSQVETKAKQDEKAKRAADPSILSKAQKKRLKRKERRKVALARDGVLNPTKVQGKKKTGTPLKKGAQMKKAAPNKKAAQSPAKVTTKPQNVKTPSPAKVTKKPQNVKTPSPAKSAKKPQIVKTPNAKKQQTPKIKKEIKKEIKMEVDS